MKQHITWRFVFLGSLLLTICACGSGGGEESATSTPPQADLGTRILPGFTVQAERLVSTAPDMIAIRASIAADTGMALPAAVEAAIAIVQPADDEWITGTVDLEVNGAWRWTTPAATPAGAHVWVRVTDVDGNVATSGAQDFAIAQ